jgi:hypothetical protein
VHECIYTFSKIYAVYLSKGKAYDDDNERELKEGRRGTRNKDMEPRRTRSMQQGEQFKD